MGNASSSTTGSTSPPGQCPVKHDQASQEGCPVKHETSVEKQQEGACPIKHETAEAKPEGGCPVKHDGPKSGQQYNVYAQPIDPSNQMPFNPNQLPAPGQKKALSTERVKSFIPKGGTDGDTWQYPSPQMFYNALMRKGKGDDVDEDEVETIVAVHNNMNEKAWNLVLNWEKNMHPEEFEKANGVRLSRFMGRPNDISPMAWVKSTLMGYPKPFDRHDWIIDRNGKEVRYVIDFYFDDEKSKQDEKPTLHDVRSIKSISMDARPAVDSLESVIDRIKFPVLQKLEKFNLVSLEDNAKLVPSKQADSSSETHEEDGPTSFEKLDLNTVREVSQKIGTNCKTCFENVTTCTTENDCQKASVALSYCMASLVCKPEAKAYLDKPSDPETFETMVGCLGRFEDAARKIKLQQQQQ